MTRQQEAAKTGGLRGPGRGRLSKPGRRLARLLPGGIRERLFLLIVLAAVPVLILQSWIYYQRHDARRDQALQMEYEVAQGVGMTYSAYLDGVHRQLDSIGQTILTFSVHTDAEIDRVLTLKGAVARHPSIRSISWVSPEGTILASNLAEGVGRDLSARPYFQQIRAGRSWAVGDLTPQGAILDSPTVAMGAAVRDDSGKLLGVVVASLEPTRLGELTFPLERYAGGMYTIFDSQGRLVYRNPPVPLTWEDRVRWRQTDPLLEQALKGQTAAGVIKSPIAGRRIIAARVPISGIGWVAGAARPMDLAMGPVRRALFEDALLGLVVASLALLLASLLARTIAEPLRRLEHDAQAMGAGVIEAPEGLQAPTEVSRLRDSVSAMATGLIDRADALRKSEERYRTLFTNMSEGFALGEAVFREDGAACNFRLLEINDAYEQQTGLTREILGKPITEVLPNMEQSWIDAYCGVARTGEPVRFVNYNKDTGRHYDVFCYSPANNRFAVLFRDVTERVQYEQALRKMNERLQEQTEELQTQAEELQAQAEELRATNEALEGREREYRTLAENAPEVIARFDRQLRHTYINEYGAKVYGVSQRAVIGKTSADLGMPADKVAFWKERLEQVLATGRQQTVDFEFDGPAFGHQYFSSLFVPEFDARGEVASILAITRDITAVKQAEQVLREEKRLFESMIESLPGTFYLFDSQGRWLKWNRNLEQISGYTAEEIARMHPLDFFAGEDKQLIERKVQEVFTQGQSSAEAELVAKDGRRIPYFFTGLLTTIGGADCLIGMGLDISERQQAEEALRRSEARLNRSQEIAHLGGWELDLARNELTWSDEVYRIFGLRPQEFGATYEAFLERAHPDDRQAVDDAYRGSVRDGRDMYEIEHRIVRKDTGEVRIVHEKCEHFRDAAGRIVRSVGMVHDITEQKQAEEALRQSEARHRRLIENLKGSHFIYVHDTEGVFQYLSESITDVLGYAPDEFMTHYDKYLTDHPANQAVRRCTELSIQGIRQPPYEVNLWHKDGSSRWLEVQEVPVFDADGTVIAVEGVAQDITERKRAEEALRESEQWFRTLTNAMPQLVWTADPDGRVDYYNERYKEYRGIEPTTDGGFHWAPVLHEEDVASTVEAWERAVRTGRTYQIEHRVQRADGSYHWHLSRGMPIRDDAGRIVKWFGTATDIDDLKQAEEALRDLTATLESKVAQRTAELEYRARQLQKLTLELSQTEDRERRRLADILHDDLQQQLAAVKFHVGLLGSRTRSDVLLQRTVAQLDGMLTDAVETSRSLSHELSPAVLYQGNLDDTFEWLANQIHTKHGLDVRVHAGVEVHVESDALKAFLYKAAQEMLFNVVKHARVGRADMRIRRTGPYVCLVVSDRGRGFNPQDLKATAGFGLFSIRERVQLLGGRMKIKSTRGKGSTFFIAVPDERMTEDERQRMEGARDLSTALRPPFSGTVLRVLVVDDHEVVRQGLAALLREEPDMEVVGEAANGREAVDLASRLQPDVIIMDVAMPLMNGDEATRQTKRHLPGIRVIALSMYAEDNMVERMRRAGAECYILKTAPADELLATIRGKKACA